MRRFAASVAGLLFMTMTGSAQQTTDGKFSGLVYADYYYDVARDTAFSGLSNTALSGAKDMNGFKLRRLYFTYDKPLSESFSMRFRLEVDESANASNGKIGTFVKDAYLKWKGIFSGSEMIIGIQPTPAYEVSESVWGYRSLEKTIMDLRGIVSSRDQGIALQGTAMDAGTVKYKVMFANNAANSPETDKYKRYFARVEASPVKNLVATVYADLAARKPLSTQSGTLGNNTMTYAGFLGYRLKGSFALGLEGYLSSLDHGYVSSGSYRTRTSMGFSAFGTYEVNTTLTVLGRFDMFDPNTSGSAKADARNYIIAGLDWHPEGNVSFIPNILVETYESPAGGSIDPSLTARLTVAYSF